MFGCLCVRAVGVGGVVLNSRGEVLMVQERVSPMAAFQGSWKCVTCVCTYAHAHAHVHETCRCTRPPRLVELLDGVSYSPCIKSWTRPEPHPPRHRAAPPPSRSMSMSIWPRESRLGSMPMSMMSMPTRAHPTRRLPGGLAVATLVMKLSKTASLTRLLGFF